MPEEKSDIANIYDSQAISENSSKKKSVKAPKSGKKKMTKNRLKAKLLSAYYGHPARDMKVICVTGTTGKTTVAHFIHNILGEANERVAVLASEGEIKTGMLHKFLSDAWKAGANYVVVTAPAESLEKDVFAGLNVHTAVLTDYIPSRIGDAPAEEYEALDDTLFDMTPEYVILNRDDKNFEKFEKTFKGEKGTLTFGSDFRSNLRIETSTLYKHGSEANLNYEGHRYTVASFLPGETTVSYMACAAATAEALGMTNDNIVNGIAAYDPDGITPIDPPEETPAE